MSSINKVQAPPAPETNETFSPQKDQRLVDAAKGFENMFVRQLISGMRKTVPDDGLMPASMGEKIFRDQLDDQYADLWVNQGGIGLAEMIYDQLEQKKGLVPGARATKPGEFLPLTKNPNEKPKDILSTEDGKLFLAKKTNGEIHLLSKEGLKSSVALRSPLPGVVLQAAALEDGRQALVVKHDNGLVSQFVHNGDNRVKSNTVVAPGDVIAELNPSLSNQSANVFFKLRKAAKTE